MKNFNELTKNCSYVQMKNFNQNNFLFDVGQRDWSRIRVVSDVDQKWNEWKNMLIKKKSWQKNVLLDYVK